MIRLEYIEVAYGKHRPVLTLESLRIGRGERVAIIGPSGAGKSTLLRCLKGYVRPRRGKVEVLGVNLACAGRRSRAEVKRRIGLIYQQFHLLELLTTVQSHHHATLVMTLHQPQLARRFAQRIIGLRAGQIAWDGPAADLTDDALQTL